MDYLWIFVNDFYFLSNNKMYFLFRVIPDLVMNLQVFIYHEIQTY